MYFYQALGPRHRGGSIRARRPRKKRLQAQNGFDWMIDQMVLAINIWVMFYWPRRSVGVMPLDRSFKCFEWLRPLAYNEEVQTEVFKAFRKAGWKDVFVRDWTLFLVPPGHAVQFELYFW